MTLKKILASFSVAVLLGLSLFAVPAYAQINIPGTGASVSGLGSSRVVNAGTLQTTILNIANIIIGLFAAVAVFYIIYGAFVWMNEGAQKGQEVVVRAVVGLLIAILAYIITQFALSAGGWVETVLNQSSGTPNR